MSKKIFFALLILSFFLREQLFKANIKHEPNQLIDRVELNHPRIIAKAERWVHERQRNQKSINVLEMIRASLIITGEELKPCKHHWAHNTNDIFQLGMANDEGYARAFGEVFQAVVNAAEKENLVMQEHWNGEQRIRLFSKLGFKCHFNKVADVQNQVIYTVNPLLFDRTGIGVVGQEHY